MEIRIESLVEGARRATGTVVIVDVFRAFTTAAVALASGAARIVIVTQPREALRLRDRGVGDLCVGEINGKRPEGFDYGNSPYQMTQAPLTDKVVILSTRSGTAGVEAATEAETIFGCSLVTAAATARAILRDAPPLVTIVAMGYNGLVRTDEDELCALYLRNLLQGRRPDPQAVATLVQASGEVARLTALHPPDGYPQDVEIALDIDKYDFAVRISKEKDFFVARRHDG
jgi:2-phosphosulfolactate phosphatase